MAVLTACSTDAARSPLESTAPEVSAQVLTGNPFVIVSDVPAADGKLRSFLADNSGRVTTEFWDNRSADTDGIERCNIGWYAVGGISPSCLNDVGPAAGSDANSVPGFTKYLADGPERRDATSFMFSGGTSFNVTLKGAYAGSTSTVGWFTRYRGAYTFHPVDAWSTKGVNTTVTINPRGKQWGLYISNGQNPQPGGCAAQTHCSDAEGGFAGMPFQQFALFTNRRGDAFLVGAEDNKLEILDNTPLYDSDYNDYIFGVRPSRVCDYQEYDRGSVSHDGKRIVISGSAGGMSRRNTVMGEFEVSVDGRRYRVSDIDSYDAIESGALSGRATARVITGTASNGASVELRVWDAEGRGRDEAYLRINGVEYLGRDGRKVELGRMRYSDNCRCEDRD